MNPLESWTTFHDADVDTMTEHAMVSCLVILASILNFYALAKLVNVFRAIWSTNFFTSRPLQGGDIAEGSEPEVTIQICCYNEEAVIAATINAACRVDWPKDKLFVQILDDSNDKTSNIVQDLASSWRDKGVDCVRFSRPTRTGYKAGNLHHWQGHARGDYVAYFDADHRCDVNFLRKTIPHFFRKDGSANTEIAMVQAPWAYYNVHANLLTEYDALNLDVSHVIEQQGRSAALGCFGFNGTGGVWRNAAVKAAGGWQWDTVTEDLDLSYLACMAGYKFIYLRDIPQQLELPSGILAHKQQKHRWTKGFWQVLRKSLMRIIMSDKLTVWHKLEAVSHMSCDISSPIALLMMILVTIMTYQETMTRFLTAYCLFPFTVVVVAVVCTVYAKATDADGHYQSFWSRTSRLGLLPVLMIMEMGMTVHKSYAVYDGIVSNDATFLRTPKEGSSSKKCRQGVTDDTENLCNNDTKDNGFATEIALIVVGLLLATYFGTFSVYVMAQSRFASWSIWTTGFLLPAVGLATVNLLMLQMLVARRQQRATKQARQVDDKETSVDDWYETCSLTTATSDVSDCDSLSSTGSGSDSESRPEAQCDDTLVGNSIRQRTLRGR